MGGTGRLLIVAGLALMVAGIVLSLGDRLPIRLGRLPGDFMWKGKNKAFYFPLMTSIVLSVLLSIVLWLVNRFR